MENINTMSQIDYLEKLRIMATINENDFGSFMVKILSTRKHAARMLIDSNNPLSVEIAKQLVSYCNSEICKILGL